ncbi:MAG TPA: ImmA/IrrE family metallo-endopeptidase [Solirubrobacteraceae bacterium]|nr:ImmA/IrrE family metallo-endopeptidase [Solirubrobacteraceae bacterium]
MSRRNQGATKGTLGARGRQFALACRGVLTPAECSLACSDPDAAACASLSIVSPEISWTNPSVLALMQEAGSEDPVMEVERRARDIALQAIEEGWQGPPYDPFELAERQGVSVVAREELEDARLVPLPSGEAQIEFNPHRRPARTRFSLAHELGHLLFPDHGERVRNRDASHRHEGSDGWQLELLCNVAAAELLMPAGAFPSRRASDLSLTHLLDLRSEFEVSTEALLRRVVKITDQPAAVFAAARVADQPRFRLDYLVDSRSWGPQARPGELVADGGVLRRCTAVGFSDDGEEHWAGQPLRVQAVGVPPYPGERFPRIVGLVQPEASVPAQEGLRYVRGDASEPRVQGKTILAHIVNNEARSWGGHGLASQLARHYPDAYEEYRRWASASGQRTLGAVHLTRVDGQLRIASLVAQAGYGEARKSRLRLRALRLALEALAVEAREEQAQVHMPLIGTGQGGMQWPAVRDLVLEELCDAGVQVVVYVLPGAAMPEEELANRQLSIL